MATPRFSQAMVPRTPSTGRDVHTHDLVALSVGFLMESRSRSRARSMGNTGREVNDQSQIHTLLHGKRYWPAPSQRWLRARPRTAFPKPAHTQKMFFLPPTDHSSTNHGERWGYRKNGCGITERVCYSSNCASMVFDASLTAVRVHSDGWKNECLKTAYPPTANSVLSARPRVAPC